MYLLLLNVLDELQTEGQPSGLIYEVDGKMSGKCKSADESQKDEEYSSQYGTYKACLLQASNWLWNLKNRF